MHRGFGNRTTTCLISACLVAAVTALDPLSHAAGQTVELEALTSRIDSLAAAALAEGPGAGLAIGIRIGDSAPFVRGYGFADLELGVPVDAETVFRIGSITKQFTAAAILQLVESGRLALDDRLEDLLPGYPTQGHAVTLRHLLDHTSGIKSYTGLPAWREKMTLELSDEELVALFAHEPFDFAPGEAWKYNNSGYYLLGMIIEETSGLPYAAYLDEHVFRPLGLEHTTYCDERRLIAGRAEGYEQADGALVNDDYLSMSQPGAAGALCSTVPDLLRWSAALRSGAVVSVHGYRLMSTEKTLNDGSGTGYGFGLGIRPLDGHRRVMHGGGINGFSTVLAWFPVSELDVVVLSNTAGADPGGVADRIARWILGPSTGSGTSR